MNQFHHHHHKEFHQEHQLSEMEEVLQKATLAYLDVANLLKNEIKHKKHHIQHMEHGGNKWMTVNKEIREMFGSP
jgi:hypothetical protein